MQKKKLACENIIHMCTFAAVVIYVISIFAVNLTGRAWTNFDIYSDAILAKYMWESGTLFPKGWHFGNQIYTVATPVVTALIYGLVRDTYLALALASCFMTIAVILSYVWCLKPFVHMRSITISLLVLVGGTNISYTAHRDLMGFQIFYTMASYYACYLIGIFITLGVYFRLASQKKVFIPWQLVVLLYNLALGMQSLREMLVLNLPLCAIIILDMLLHHSVLRDHIKKQKRAYIFGGLAIFANASGLLITKVLVAMGTINQYTILGHASSNYRDNFRMAKNAFLDYIGLHWPTKPFFFVSSSFLKFLVAIFSISLIIWVFVFIIVEYRKTKKINTLGYGVLFFIISLFGVLCAGTLVINVRDIYYFCWYSLVATSVVMFMEIKWNKNQSLLLGIKYLVVLGLLMISVLNYKLTFYRSLSGVGHVSAVYEEITEQLQADGIKYLYSDWRTERNVISAMSHDDILYGTLMFSGNTDDLWDDIGYLTYDEWFEPENFENAYIVMSDYALYCLDCEFDHEYLRTFMDNLEYVYEFKFQDEIIYFFKGSEKMFHDMINGM